MKSRGFRSLFLLIALAGSSFATTRDYFSEDNTCSIFYPESGNATIKLTLNQHVANLEEGFQSTAENSTWIPMQTFSIRSGCEVNVCNDTDFGYCQTFEASGNFTPQLKPTEYADILSASCTCDKVCTCEQQRIGKTGCARAYIKKGCNVCKAYYMDMRSPSKKFLPHDAENNIKSIVVRPGCTLNLYPEEDFEGQVTIIEGITQEAFRGQVRSYECSCHGTPETKIPKPRPAHYPEMIEMPTTVDGVSGLLSTVGRHPGVMSALKSYKSKRSTKNAYILLLGLTGAGKSSAINLLFDNPNITKVGIINSTTTDIHEFRIPITVDDLGISNAELRVIDTPGLVDTRGLEQDARFLATLDDYLANHEELKHRRPNVVLVFGKFHDNRFSGKASAFVKMLNAVDIFRERITDKSYSNVVFVLSHFMSMTNDVTRRPADRIKLFKNVIEEFSLFPKPISIVVAENRGDAHDLPMLNGFYKLPNGEFYPRNLFDKIQQLTTYGNDPIGEAIIRAAFKDSDDFNITVNNFPLVEATHGKSLKYYQDLLKSIIVVEDTEVSRLLAEVEKIMPQALKSNYPDALPHIQRAFNLRKINTKADLPHTQVETIQFLKDIKQNEANVWLMNKALGLKAPVFDDPLIVGHSYNVIQDKPLPTSPIVMTELQPSDIGYLLPSVVSCELTGDTVATFKTFPTKADYVTFRLESMGVQGKVPDAEFKGETAPGSSIIGKSAGGNTSAPAAIQLSALQQHRTFKLSLNTDFKVSPEFAKAVKLLPPFNQTSLEVVSVWKSFFDTYGTHVVSSIYGGGSVEVKLTSESGFNAEVAKTMYGLLQFAEGISIGQVGNGTMPVIGNGTTYALKFLGGERKNYMQDLTRVSLATITNLMESWKESIKLAPTILKSDMRLLPISSIAKKVAGMNISSEIDRAVGILFAAQLIHVPLKRPENEIPTDRVNTGALGSSSSSDFQVFTKMMLEMVQRSDARTQEILAQMYNSNRAQEERRAADAKEQREWERQQAVILQDYQREERKRGLDLEETKHKAEMEFKQTQADREDARAIQERNWRIQQAAAERDYNDRKLKLQEEIEKNKTTGSSCLTAGTLIRMASGEDKNVEAVEVGDVVMDGQLRPTRVLAASYEFLIDGNIFGFNDETPFFTDNHIFVGENDELYAESTEILIHGNPLMEKRGVKDMGGGFRVKHLEGDTVVLRFRQVHKETTKSPPETKVYFLQVDSPEGTYIANGYITHHEIPPFELWPRTMPTLFSLAPLVTSCAEKIPYTIENLVGINKLIADLKEVVQQVVVEFRREQVVEASEESQEEGEGDGDFDAILSQLFANPTVSALAIGIYSSSGKVIAEYIEEKEWTTTEIQSFQNKIRESMESRLEKCGA